MIKIQHIIKPRQFGKTYECMRRSAKTGAVIITKDVATSVYIKRRAKEIGLNMPDPMPVRQLLKDTASLPEDTHIIIDDADMILLNILRHRIDVISMVSRTPSGLEEVPGHMRPLIGGEYISEEKEEA